MEDHPVVLESLEFPEPVISLAVEPQSKADQIKLAKGLEALSEEDPTFRVNVDEETGQTLIRGMGELHLEIIVDRLRREFGVEVKVGRPQVSYREAVRKLSRAQGRFVRQSGGRGQYGDVTLELEPLEGHKGYEWVDRIVGGVVPKEYIPAAQKGVEEAMNNGILGGTRSSECGSPSWTAATTTWTAPRWPSRSPAPWPSKRPCARPIRSSWSPSWTWKW